MKKTGKRKVAPKPHKSATSINVEKALIDNFISLQRVLTNLSSKFEELSDKISKLLQLFEISAKALAEKDFDIGTSKKDKEIIKKLDTLIDQNKTIARGVSMLHEQEETDYEEEEDSSEEHHFKPLPRI